MSWFRPLSLILAAIAASTLPASLAAAQELSPPATNEPVRTPAVAAGERLVRALNGDAAARADFVRGSFTASALRRRSAEQRTEALDRLAADAGGFTVLTVRPQGEQMVEIVAATRRGGRFARFVLFTGRLEPDKLVDIFVLAARDPAQVARTAWPAGAVPPARIPREIGRRVAALASEDAFAGAVLVARGDEVIFRRAYGLANADWAIPNRADTLFNIASVGKMFTAAAILRLAEQGALSLDDHVARWLPEYPDAEAARRITLRHLLTHRAGLGPWDGRDVRAASAREAVRSMTAPAAAPPGERFAYSNAGYVLLGAVIEAATGRAYEEAVRDLVFEPAGMHRTGYWPVTAIVPNRATGYLRPESDPLGFRPRYANHQFLGFGGDASGGAYSTVDDLFAFHRALLSGRLLGEDGLHQMIAAQTDFPGTPRPSRYGYGTRLTECAGRPVFGHSGGGANSGVSASTLATPDGDWTVIVLSNYDPVGEELALDICDLLARQ